MVTRQLSFSNEISTQVERHFLGLISNEVLSCTTQLFSQTNSGMSDFWGYEIHLDDSLKTDFLFCIHKSKQLIQLAESVKRDTLHVPFRKFSEFAQAWNDPHNFLHKTINNFWFEIDEEELVHTPSRTSFFFAPNPNHSPLALCDIVQEVLSYDEGVAELKPAFKCLFQAAHVLPEHAKIMQVGQMKSRGEKGFRIFVQGLKKDDLKTFLDDMKYAQFYKSNYAQLYQDMIDHGAKVELNFDLGQKIGPKIGFEAYFDDWRAAVGYLNHQVDLGECPQTSAQVLKETVDRFNDIQHDLSPFFSHFKRNHHPEKSSKLKAYLAFSNQTSTPKVRRTPHSNPLI